MADNNVSTSTFPPDNPPMEVESDNHINDTSAALATPTSVETGDSEMKSSENLGELSTKGLSNRALKRLRQKERHKQSEQGNGNAPSTSHTFKDFIDPLISLASKPKEKSPQNQVLSNRAAKRQRRIERGRDKGRKIGNRKTEDRGYSANIFSETEYYFEDGLRKVYPYRFTFSTFAKERWFNKTLIEVFTKEFFSETPEVYRLHIHSGKILVNGKRTKPGHILKNGDEISHTIHRHENPVIGDKIEIISDTEDLLVINKPASIPCHPCGKYRYNSIVFILGKEYGYCNLRNIYRLDRLTSGVLILGKTVQKTKQLEDQIVKRLVQKEYVCRVSGEFPEGTIKVDQPLACMRHNLTLWRVQEGGKESQTTFERLSYNGETSVVKCTPHTGRTHQIRVHLQFLGFPIVNDPFYNTEAWGPSRGKNGLMENDEKDIVEAIMKEHNVGQWVEGDNPYYIKKLAEVKGREMLLDHAGEDKREAVVVDKENMEESTTEPVDIEDTESGLPAKRKKLSSDIVSTFDESKLSVDLYCEECKNKYRNPSFNDLVLYLHAYKYKGPDWEYEAPLPEWASEDWKEKAKNTTV